MILFVIIPQWYQIIFASIQVVYNKCKGKNPDQVLFFIKLNLEKSKKCVCVRVNPSKAPQMEQKHQHKQFLENLCHPVQPLRTETAPLRVLANQAFYFKI